MEMEKKEDRFSDLPESLIHHIFTYLGKDRDDNIPSLRATSKIFRKLCKSYLSFKIPNSDKYAQFENYLDVFRTDKDPSIDIVSLNIVAKMELLYNMDCYMDWMHEAVKSNVEEINIKIKSSIQLPSFIFDCKSLRVLKIDALDVHLPRLVLTNVEEFSLKSPILYDHLSDHRKCAKQLSLGEWISSCCPSLKRLSIWVNRINPDFTITSSSLEDLVVYMDIQDTKYHIDICTVNLKTLSLNLPSYHVDINREKYGKNIVRINAPDLQDFTFIVNRRLKDCDFSGEFISLQKAFIIVPSDCNYLAALYRGIKGAANLQIDNLVFRTLWKSDEYRRDMTVNLQHLIVNFSNSLLTYHFISIVKELINLKSLTIIKEDRLCYVVKDTKNDVGEEDGENEAHHFTHLKELVILANVTHDSTRRFLKYFLKYAKNLEKLIVDYPDDFFLFSAIQNFEIASTSLKLYLEEQRKMVLENYFSF